MKKIFLLALAITTFFIWLNRNDTPDPPAANSTPVPVRVSGKSRAVSEHDWARHSLDRANQVAGEVRQARAQDGQP